MKEKIIKLFVQLFEKLQGNPVVFQQPSITTEHISDKHIDNEIKSNQKYFSVEDSVLKRHHNQLVESINLIITNPYPTDSVLKRHYDTQAARSIMRLASVPKIQTAAEEHTNSTINVEVNHLIDAEPQDSILKRHFVQQSESLKIQRINPYPTDSVLKRHYDNLVWSRA